MENYITFLAITAVSVTILFLSRYWLNKRTEKGNDSKSILNIIRQPKMLLYVGIGRTIIFVAIALIFLLAPESMIADYEDGMRLPVFFVLLTICIPYLFMVMLRVNWKIEMGEDKFTFRNTFGRRYTYKYSEITVKSLNSGSRYYRNDKRIFGVSYFQTNWDLLEIEVYMKQQK